MFKKNSRGWRADEEERPFDWYEQENDGKAFQKWIKIRRSRTCLPAATTRKIVMIGLVAAALLLALIITVLVLVLPSVGIEDTNGEDTSLAVITMEEMLSTSGNSTAVGTRQSSFGSRTKTTGNLRDVDRESSSFSSKSLSGVKTLHATKADCDSLTLNITSALTAGNAEIIIMVDGEYYTHVALDQTDRIVLEDIANKEVVVRIGAESAEISVSVSRELN